MHLLYERRSAPEMPVPSVSPATERLPLPILLRVPRFADGKPKVTPAVPSEPLSIRTVSPVRRAEAPGPAVAKPRRRGRPKRKILRFTLMFLAIVAAMVISGNPRLLDPAIERWIEFQQSGYKITGWSFDLTTTASPTDETPSIAASPNRSAWLAPEIIPIETGD